MEHNYKSSFYFTTITPFTSDDYRKAKHIINHIIENPESFEFRQPVDWQGLGLTDYLEIIKNPMDLGTIRSKLEEEAYVNIQQFLDDFELIWDNCKSYNIKGTWIYALADKLEKNGKKMLKNYFPSIPIQSLKNMNQPPPVPKASSKSKKSEPKPQTTKQLFYEDEEQITITQKQYLADSFKAFSPEKNRQLVEYIQSVCPTAFRQVGDQVQIIVDHMDIITFKQVMQYFLGLQRKVEEIENEQEGESPLKRVKQI